ncbi:MAG: galactokinase, partial [Terriglobales bacterium]
LAQRGASCGADVFLHSEVPIGAGLSSSAAVEVALAYALSAETGLALGPIELAQLCQRASHEFASTRCGIMDLYIACEGRAGHIARLDTRSLEARWLAWPSAAGLLVCDSGVRHQHAGGGYNQRRAECEAAVAALSGRYADLHSLRDLDLRQLESARATLDPALFARARHVVSENARVLAAAEALERADFPALGAALNASHASLRDDYQVSCPELDRLAALCQRHPGVWGARMMGGGFGGCVLALAEPAALPALEASLAGSCARASLRVHPGAGAARLC